jgi:hypothetical protein
MGNKIPARECQARDQNVEVKKEDCHFEYPDERKDISRSDFEYVGSRYAPLHSATRTDSPVNPEK